MLEAMGALSVTLILLYGTVHYMSAIILQGGFGGFDVLDWQEWVLLIVIGLILTGLWVGWWFLVGTHISIGFN